jgi:hypothetical protein
MPMLVAFQLVLIIMDIAPPPHLTVSNRHVIPLYLTSHIETDFKLQSHDSLVISEVEVTNPKRLDSK